MFVSLCFICALVITSSAVTRPPKIIAHPPKTIYFNPGETMRIPVCKADGDPTPEYSWTKNGVEFQPGDNDNRITLVEDPYNQELAMYFNSSQAGDEGVYQCVATNSLGRAVSVKTRFLQPQFGEFPLSHSSHEVEHRPQLGGSLTLPCDPPQSVPPAKVVWIKVTDPERYTFKIIEYDARVNMDKEYRLRFANVLEADGNEGKPYRCLAMNEILRQNRQGPGHIVLPQGTLELQETAILWADQSDSLGLRGERLSLQCIFSGNPTPDIFWERLDGKPMPGHAQVTKFGTELVFEELQYDDAGLYSCFATNPFRKNRRSRTFNIKTESAPYFTEVPREVEIVVGGNVELTCSADGRPAPDIIWLVNGVPLQEARTRDRRLQDTNKFSQPVAGKLIFRNVNIQDNMAIQCNATNKHGYALSGGYLNILAPPFITDVPQTLNVTLGSSINISCSVAGKPQPNITWFRDGQQIAVETTGDLYTILPSGSLNIQSVALADAGQFVCRAHNSVGEFSEVVELMVHRNTTFTSIGVQSERSKATSISSSDLSVLKMILGSYLTVILIAI